MTPVKTDVLRVEAVSKRYRPPPSWLRPVLRTATKEPVDALAQVSFGVAAGEVVGLVGPNGSGKTTLIKTISTLIEPDEGSIQVAGLDTSADSLQARRHLGAVLTDERGLYWRLNGRQNLELFGVLAGLGGAEARRRTASALERVGLDDDAKRVFGYSSGMRGRLNIARALIAEPALLVLDEPTRSLDPIVSRDVQAVIRQSADEGAGVLLSSHDLHAVSAICDRVVVLLGGRVRFVGAISELGEPSTATASIMDILSGQRSPT